MTMNSPSSCFAGKWRRGRGETETSRTHLTCVRAVERPATEGRAGVEQSRHGRAKEGRDDVGSGGEGGITPYIPVLRPPRRRCAAFGFAPGKSRRTFGSHDYEVAFPCFAGKWRRGRDSNPRYRRRYNGFRDRPIQPLLHLSVIGNCHPRSRLAIEARRKQYNGFTRRLLRLALRAAAARRSGLFPTILGRDRPIQPLLHLSVIGNCHPRSRLAIEARRKQYNGFTRRLLRLALRAAAARRSGLFPTILGRDRPIQPLLHLSETGNGPPKHDIRALESRVAYENRAH